jgi:hypothetical protein
MSYLDYEFMTLNIIKSFLVFNNTLEFDSTGSNNNISQTVLQVILVHIV